MNNIIKHLIASCLCLAASTAFAQDPSRFTEKVDQLSNADHHLSPDKETVVFTGSSSIVRWKDLQSVFPKYNIINNGFGGSQFSDLIYFYDALIKRSAPNILFIYEGDNDVASGEDPKNVFKEAKELIRRIRSDLPQTRIILIAPKPSLRNWSKRENYKVLNGKLKSYCDASDKLEFADVWEAMVDADGIVFQDIFVEDGDHMNEKGYAIWKNVIGSFLE